MRKRNKGRILSRPKNQRQALLALMAANLFLKAKIKTTEAKAKEARVVIEKSITRAKSNTLANRRLLLKSFTPKVTKKLIEEIAPKYANRHGGYTRIIGLGLRASDSAKMVILELV